jgi:UDP-N-acetylmuramoylalanine--D-glutamate ligase
VYRLADAQGRPIVSEFDLAAEWDDRPLVAITGTNGKTTVTTLVTQMLNRAGVTAVAAGNVDTPLVEAIDDTSEPRAEVFVVEASSFRLERVSRFAPRVGAWLNFAPDHLDWHDNLDQYAQAKARIWAAGGASTVAVVPAGDALITDAAARYGAPTVTFGIGDGDVSWVDDVLYLDGAPVVRLDQIRRRLRHDQLNAAAAVAIASQMGASIDAMAAVLGDFAGLDHRMALVATIDGVAWYDEGNHSRCHRGRRERLDQRRVDRRWPQQGSGLCAIGPVGAPPRCRGCDRRDRIDRRRTLRHSGTR